MSSCPCHRGENSNRGHYHRRATLRRRWCPLQHHYGLGHRQLKTDNTIFVAASFALVDVETKKVLWEAQWPYGRVSVKATQPWHDIRYYIARVVEETFATLP